MSASGPPITGFRKGWAKVLASGNRGHYFEREGASQWAVSTCGVETTVPSLYGIGTYAPCRICRKRHGPPPDVRTFIDTMAPDMLARSPAARQIAEAIARED